MDVFHFVENELFNTEKTLLLFLFNLRTGIVACLMGRRYKGIVAVTKCSQKTDDRTLEGEIVYPVEA